MLIRGDGGYGLFGIGIVSLLVVLALTICALLMAVNYILKACLDPLSPLKLERVEVKYLFILLMFVDVGMRMSL